MPKLPLSFARAAAAGFRNKRLLGLLCASSKNEQYKDIRPEDALDKPSLPMVTATGDELLRYGEALH
jgi:hypothetical protein